MGDHFIRRCELPSKQGTMVWHVLPRILTWPDKNPVLARVTWWSCRHPTSNGETPVVTHISASTELLPSPKKLLAIPSVYTSLFSLANLSRMLARAAIAALMALESANIKRRPSLQSDLVLRVNMSDLVQSGNFFSQALRWMVADNRSIRAALGKKNFKLSVG